MLFHPKTRPSLIISGKRTQTDDYFLSNIGNKNLLNSRLEGKPKILSSDRICEAVNCYEAATKTINVSAGKFGTINLNLCHDCAINKFEAERVKKAEMRRNESRSPVQRDHTTLKQSIAALDKVKLE
jgi:hypothetical protein